MAGAIANDPNALMTSIRRGQTVETRNETQLRGLLKRLDTAHAKGPEAWEAEMTKIRAEIVDLGVAVAQGNAKLAATARTSAA